MNLALAIAAVYVAAIVVAAPIMGRFLARRSEDYPRVTDGD